MWEPEAVSKRPNGMAIRRRATTFGLAIAVAACGSTSSGSTSPSSDAASPDLAASGAAISETAPTTSTEMVGAAVVGPVWWLTEITLDDNDVTVTGGELTATHVQFVADFDCDGRGCPTPITMVGYDACNQFWQSVTVDDDTVTPGRDGATEDAGCAEGAPAAISELLNSAFTYELAAEELIISSTSDVSSLVFRTDDDPLGPSPLDVLIAGQVDSYSYRLAWEGGGGGLFEWDDLAETAFRRNVIGTGIDETQPIDAVVMPFAPVVFGTVAPDVARLTITSSGAQPADVSLVDAPDGTGQVFVQPIDDPTATEPLVITAYDIEGGELAKITVQRPTE